ncbi:hypothetical protein [Acinetobacter sp. MB5]|uniref:capsular polysaccharide export protein, LipB/KpsS family n=1 Tax=Acinetobacter sp. MB5 TaxID=2069438 RepID=UPI000DCFFE5B|nr:hypothetical protein [Acinetobacter sp. MB5]
MSLDKLSILFADNLHFHDRNFKSLFDFFNKNKIKYDFVNIDKSWLSLYGNYFSKKSNLGIYCDLLQKMDAKDLYEFSIDGHNVFHIARSELLSYLIPKEEWVDSSIVYDYELFVEILKKNKEPLLLNMAAVCYWFDFWKSYLDAHKVYSYCCIFSGALIYSKVLLKCLETRVTNPLLFESSFTGLDYYCEFQYNVIPNNSVIGYKNYYSNIKLDYDDYFLYKKDEHKAINKIRLMNNKNVVQPLESTCDDIKFENSNKNVTILGQVINDFSILESDLNEYNSLLTYKKMIREILDKTNFNIIFKAHPWELNKINIYKSLTKDSLSDFINLFNEDDKKRIKIIEDYNIKKLFSNSSHVITLCSQAGLEAAYYGLKPIQIGKAFYGEKGFTFDVNDLDIVTDILNNQVGFLSLNEFNSYTEFLVKFLLKHLVSVNPSGYINLREIFSPMDRVNLINKVNNDKPKLIAEVKNKVKVSDVDKKPNVVSEMKVSKKDQIETKMINDDGSSLVRVEKKISKLIYNPERFFGDSKYQAFRKIGHLYKAIKQK